MAKKHKQRLGANPEPTDLRARIERAQQEGRFQHALELAKQLRRLEPTAAHEELLRSVYLGRVRQLRERNGPAEARTLLDYVLTLDCAEPAWLEALARELAACGDARRALALLDRLPPSTARAAVLEQAADTALEHSGTGRASLPVELQAPFDAVVQAFAQLAAGEDEAVKQSLQAIGLQSPFLEWKVLLRGLQAYYQNDDTRALENWSRLRKDRLPSRLAAPLRLLIDPAFAAAQSPEAQALLRRQADRLQSGPLAAGLRSVQAAVGAGDVAQALRQAEGLVPTLRQQAPPLLGRLARCLQWVITEHGDVPDLRRYKKVFGAPPDDPELDRIAALAMEHHNLLPEAHQAWQRYEKAVAAHPTAWPPGQADRVRALIWHRMGENARAAPSDAVLDMLPPFLRGHPDRPQPLKPDTAECFQRSLRLAPDQLATHQALVDHLALTDQSAAAEKAARSLLERFPDDVETLETLADLRCGGGAFAEAVQFLQRATRVNPLDRRLRSKLSAAHALDARTHAEAGRFDAARAGYQTALTLAPNDHFATRCQWAVSEFKAGQVERAEEILLPLRGDAVRRLAAAYLMAVEAIRFKLPAALKKRCEADFAAVLGEPPTASLAAEVLKVTAALAARQVKYRGQPAHTKRLLDYLGRVPKDSFTEAQLSAAAVAMLDLDPKKARALAKTGQQRFPRNPRFFLVEVDTLLLPKPKPGDHFRAGQLLERARRLAEALPAGDEQDELFAEIDDLGKLVSAAGFGGVSPFASILGDFFGRAGGLDLPDFGEERW